MYRGQHSRKAFGPGRKVTKAQQAQYIAESIQDHQRRGWSREVREYTPDHETQQLVQALLTQAA
jgi:hypothetical protein